MTYLNNSLEDLKRNAQSLFSDAISIRNPKREEFMKEFLNKYSEVKNSVDGTEFSKLK